MSGDGFVKLQREQWFEGLFGFREDEVKGNPEMMREKMELREDTLVSLVNGATYGAGTFACPSLGELRDAARRSTGFQALKGRGKLDVVHVHTRDIFELHCHPEWAGATFMAASQANCLEFVDPETVPEDGVTNYIFDATQGPACALAAPAATVVRNYFVPINGRFGQTSDNQLNMFADLLARLHGDGPELVTVRNGYTDASDASLQALNERLMEAGPREALLDLLRIGLHFGVEVPWAGSRYTLAPPERRQKVTQAFCSAVSCGYSNAPAERWEPLARLILDASYEATLWAAALEAAEGRGSGQVLLTFLGGGVFGNRQEWIESAISRACAQLADVGLRVVVCHHGRVDDRVAERIDSRIASHL